MTDLTISTGERGAIRVFAINMPAAEVSDALKSLPKPDLARQLLGNPHLDTRSTEIFPITDLTGMGLGSYLTEGYAVDAAQIDPDRQKLDALEGYILLLFSDSFAGTDVTLRPGVALTLIGTYLEYQPAGGTGAIAAQSAKPYSGAPGKPVKSATRSRYGSVVVVVIVVLVLGLGLWGFAR